MRASTSIVIPAWNGWELTRACLESLRPTLRLHDQVVVVDNGSTDGTAAGLRRYPWVEVVTNEQNLGFAAGCNRGAAAATRDVLVFLNNDTLVPSRWLDGLLAPFADPAVGAVGPRSNFVSGPQLVPDTDYDPQRPAEVTRFGRSWRDEHRGQTTDVPRLIGFCLAVPRPLFERIGRFDEDFGLGGAEDDDLCLRISDAGYRLVIAHESFVHHHGHGTFEINGVDRLSVQARNLRRLATKRRQEVPRTTAPPLLSACLIVKDEQDDLETCLASLAGLVDEVVVYDTGSTDRTREIARAAGARVLEGFWDDDFSRARNAALEGCSGEWILHVDADEVVTGDRTAIRADLARRLTEDYVPVRIDNLSEGGEVSFRHEAVRLFRRKAGHWSGRLHEQVVARPGAVLRAPSAGTSLLLRHHGYTAQAMDARGKAERNLRLAEMEVDLTGGTDGQALLQLGRSLGVAGRPAEALDAFRRARAATREAHVLRLSLRHGAECLIVTGRAEEALEWVSELRSHTSSTAIPDYIEGHALLQLGRLEAALACLSRIDELEDEDHGLPRHMLLTRRGITLCAQERWDEAADELLSAVRDATAPLAWAPLVLARHRSGRPMRDVADAVPDSELLTVLAHLLGSPAQAADALAQELWRRCPQDPRLLAFVGTFARRLPLEGAMEWAVRLRAAGLDDCPLLAAAADRAADPLDRLRSAAVAFELFDDARCRAAVAAAAADVATERFLEGLAAVDALSPRLLGDVVSGAAGTPDRRRAMAAVLTAVGAEQQAQALLAGVA